MEGKELRVRETSRNVCNIPNEKRRRGGLDRAVEAEMERRGQRKGISELGAQGGCQEADS